MPAQVSWVLCSGCHKASIKVSAGMHSHLGLDWSKIHPKLSQVIGRIDSLADVGLRAPASECWLLGGVDLEAACGS